MDLWCIVAMSKDRQKQAAKRAKKRAAGRKPRGILNTGPMFPADEAQQMNALRSSGMFGTPEEFDDVYKALADSGFVDALERGR